jgi:anti-sigma B factor antagonist
MEIKITNKDSYLVVDIIGSVDMYTAVELKEVIDEIELEPNDALIFNFANVNYVDSSGIGTLIKIVNSTQDQQARFYIAHMKSMIEKVFNVAGLMNYFSILSNEEFKEKFPY